MNQINLETRRHIYTDEIQGLFIKFLSCREFNTRGMQGSHLTAEQAENITNKLIILFDNYERKFSDFSNFMRRSEYSQQLPFETS